MSRSSCSDIYSRSAIKIVIPNLTRYARKQIGRIPGARGFARFAFEIKGSVLDSSARDRTSMEQLYASKADPYDFASEPERFDRACKMLDSVRPHKGFDRALEIGCSEGAFTERLASRCHSIVALDISTVALARARERCRDFTNVTFGEWDLRQGPIVGPFDLIIAVGVLEYIRRPKTVKVVCDRLVKALRPGDYLLLGNTVADDDIERRWWAKYLLRGTLINKHVARDSRLQVISTAFDEFLCPFEHILFRRRQD